MQSIQHAFCDEARKLYLTDRAAQSDANDWARASWEARRLVVGFLRDSFYLTDVAAALIGNGSHSIALRHLLAPPVSQDQFKLLCPQWSKSSEKSRFGIPSKNAHAVAAVFHERRSRRLTSWLEQARSPTMAELFSVVGSVAPLIANQRVATARRNRLSLAQENAVISVLTARGWDQLSSVLVSQAGQLPSRKYMHTTKFSSGPDESQEVDVACGIGGTVVLAMECKVTNDHTNSVKRINDVLKKAHAWKAHWGTFVRPAAVLQGVIKPSDVDRLANAGVEVFWTHRLDLFDAWIEKNVK